MNISRLGMKKFSGLSPKLIQYIPLQVPIFIAIKLLILTMPKNNNNRALQAYASKKAKAAHTAKALGDGVILKIFPSMERFKTKQDKLTKAAILEK